MYYSMKYLRLLSATMMIASGLWAAELAAQDIVTPEQLYPQLKDILQQAVVQSPRMINRALDLEMAENDRITARANLLPSVSASGSYYRSKDRQQLLNPNVVSASAPAFYVTKTPYSAAISQPLYSWGERRNLARMGEIRQSIAQGQYRDGYRLLAQTLRGDYLRLIVLKLSAKRAHFSQEMASSLLQQDEERLLKKVVSEAQLFGTRIYAERAQIALEQADSSLENGVHSFGRLSGLGKAFTEKDIPDSVPVVAPAAAGLDQLMAGFLAQKELPSLEAATLRQQLKLEDLTYKNSRTRLWPKLNASAGLSQDEQLNYFGSGAKYRSSSLYAGISVNWTIFDGFAAGAAERSSLARRRQLENDYQQLTERLAEDAQSQVKQIGYNARSMSITDRLLNSAEGNQLDKMKENARGVASETQVNQAKLELFDALISAYSARRDYLINVGDFLGLVVQDPVVANVANKK